MSEPATDPVVGESAPAVEPPAQAAPAATPETKPDNAPEWLPERLSKAKESERKKLLQEAGVESADDLKAKLARLQELETQQLSEQERTQKQIEDLTARSQQFDSLQKSFASIVEAEFSRLSEQQQQAIDAKAEGNAQRRWEYMEFLKASGSPVATPEPVAKPATTKAPGATPPPASPQNPQTPRAKYEALLQTDPVQAALYRLMHAQAIESSPS